MNLDGRDRGVNEIPVQLSCHACARAAPVVTRRNWGKSIFKMSESMQFPARVIHHANRINSTSEPIAIIRPDDFIVAE